MRNMITRSDKSVCIHLVLYLLHTYNNGEFRVEKEGVCVLKGTS